MSGAWVETGVWGGEGSGLSAWAVMWGEACVCGARLVGEWMVGWWCERAVMLMVGVIDGLVW